MDQESTGKVPVRAGKVLGVYQESNRKVPEKCLKINRKGMSIEKVT